MPLSKRDKFVLGKAREMFESLTFDDLYEEATATSRLGHILGETIAAVQKHIQEHGYTLDDVTYGKFLIVAGSTILAAERDNGRLSASN